VPMFETMAQFILSDHMCGHTFDPPMGPTGYARILNRHRRPYATSDGHLCVLLYNDKHWKTFFELIGKAEIMEQDPRFSTIGKRTEHIHELYEMVAEIMPTRTTAQWQAMLEAADIPVMPMHTMESLIDDPHLKAVEFLQFVEHPTEGLYQSIAVPSNWSKSQPRVTRHAPRAGEHGAEVLRELGYDAQAIEQMQSAGVTQIPPAPEAAPAS